jgi:hypothetical protein
VVENTFTCIEDMAGKMLPPLALLLGSGRPLNFIVTNRWRNYREIARITRLPLMMIVSMRVGGWVGGWAAAHLLGPGLGLGLGLALGLGPRLQP